MPPHGTASPPPQLRPAPADAGLPSPPGDGCEHGNGEGACYACFAAADRPPGRGPPGAVDDRAEPVQVPPGRWAGAPLPASPPASFPGAAPPDRPSLPFARRPSDDAPLPPQRRPSLPFAARAPLDALPARGAGKTPPPLRKRVSFGAVHPGTTWGKDDYERGMVMAFWTLPGEDGEGGEGEEDGVPPAGTPHGAAGS